MDQRLLKVGRAVKQRRKNNFATLWYFTDSARAPDPLPAIAGLPRGIAGVIFRHDHAPGRAALAADVAALCKSRGVALVIAGDTRLAARLGAGVHLRGGRWPDHRRVRGLITSSAHDEVEIHRARRAGARVIFISPVFASASHPGERVLGPLRWARLARLAVGTAYALGGITGANIRRLPSAAGAGAIAALSS
jgi:thiamine-phosphate pyrophosphorylase